MSWNESGNQDPWGKPGQQKPSQPNQTEPKPNDAQPEQAGWESPKPNQDKPHQDPQPEKPNQGNGTRQEQSPPDLEEAFNSLLNKINRSAKNGNPNGGAGFGKLLPFALIIGAIVWAGSGFYTIQEAERGVVTRFGKLNEIVLPGLNWKPTFIDEVTPVNIERVAELRTGGSMLTQDENMVQVEMTVQFRIEDPAKYLFNVNDPDGSLKQATDSALRYVIGHMTMDEILTTGRAIVRERTWNALRDIIKTYDMGLLVTDVNFQSARPPEQVKEAFDDAIKAQEDEQRLIREAEAYARGQEPIARGKAQRIVEQATAYKEQAVLEAQGEVAHFEKLLPEYQANPAVFRDRMYLQTMENVMKNTPKVLMEGNGNALPLLPLDKLIAQPNKTEQPAQTVSEPAPQPQTQPTQPASSFQSGAVSQPAQQPADNSVRKGRF